MYDIYLLYNIITEPYFETIHLSVTPAYVRIDAANEIVKMCAAYSRWQRSPIRCDIARRLVAITIFLLSVLTMLYTLKVSRQRCIKVNDVTNTVEQQPRLAVVSSLWSDQPRYTRHAFSPSVCSYFHLHICIYHEWISRGWIIVTLHTHVV